MTRFTVSRSLLSLLSNGSNAVHQFPEQDSEEFLRRRRRRVHPADINAIDDRRQVGLSIDLVPVAFARVPRPRRPSLVRGAPRRGGLRT